MLIEIRDREQVVRKSAINRCEREINSHPTVQTEHFEWQKEKRISKWEMKIFGL